MSAAPSLSRLVPWLVAALFAVTASALLLKNTSLRRENSDLRAARELAEVAYRIAQNQLTERTVIAEQLINNLGRKLQRREDLTRLKVTPLAAVTPDFASARAIAVWDDEQGAGLLTAEKLPALPAGSAYQVWIVGSDSPQPLHAGDFSPAPDGRVVVALQTEKPVRAITGFEISVGTPHRPVQPERAVVLRGP